VGRERGEAGGRKRKARLPVLNSRNVNSEIPVLDHKSLT
jgi:hypothetical protein